MGNIIQKAKQILSRKTTGAVIGLIVAFVYLTKVFGKQVPTVKLSYFLAALSQNKINEVQLSFSSL